MKNYFETDASEVEDLYDSTGVDGLPVKPTSSIVNLDLFSAAEEEHEVYKPVGKEAFDGPKNEDLKLSEQLSANGRTLLRIHFSASNPIELPRGHTTIAFSEPQIHAALKTISDETVRPLLHSMRALVLPAVSEERVQLVLYQGLPSSCIATPQLFHGLLVP